MADPVNTAASRSRARGQRRLRRRGRGESAGGVMAALSSLGIPNTIPQEPLRCNKSTTVDARVLDGEGTGENSPSRSCWRWPQRGGTIAVNFHADSAAVNRQGGPHV